MTDNRFQPFHDVLGNVKGTIEEHREALGRPVIGVMPAYFPLELVDAAGGYPVQLWGNNLALGKSDAYLQSFCCSLGKSVMELELGGGAGMVQGYAFTSLCDTLINLREIYRRVFDKPTVEFSIPATGSVQARRNYFDIVLKEVLAGLGKMTGQQVTPDSLRQSAERYGRLRELQRRLYQIRRAQPGLMKNYDFYAAIKAGFFLPALSYNEMLEKLLAELEGQTAPAGKRKKLLLTGMYLDPIGLYKDVFDELNVDIVDDDLANGRRTASKATLMTDNLTEGVIEYVYKPAPCCCIYNPANDRHPYLLELVRESGAEGVLFLYQKFCEPDAFERPQLIDMLKSSGIPASFFEVEMPMRNFEPIHTRVNAFIEMLD